VSCEPKPVPPPPPATAFLYPCDCIPEEFDPPYEQTAGSSLLGYFVSGGLLHFYIPAGHTYGIGNFLVRSASYWAPHMRYSLSGVSFSFGPGPPFSGITHATFSVSVYASLSPHIVFTYSFGMNWKNAGWYPRFSYYDIYCSSPWFERDFDAPFSGLWIDYLYSAEKNETVLDFMGLLQYTVSGKVFIQPSINVAIYYAAITGVLDAEIISF